jgi:hypothetical protein
MTKEEVHSAMLYGPFREDGLLVDMRNWRREELETAKALAQEGADKRRQQLSHAEWMDTFLRPLWNQHPKKTFAEIADMLPEPERTIARRLHLRHIRLVCSAVRMPEGASAGVA